MLSRHPDLRRGFTLIELLVVIGIASVLMGQGNCTTLGKVRKIV